MTMIEIPLVLISLFSREFNVNEEVLLGSSGDTVCALNVFLRVVVMYTSADVVMLVENSVDEPVVKVTV